ncbi:unnamed protein product [Sphagnum balticum]
MAYTAYNGSSILLNLARTANPFDRNGWDRLGPVFPNYQNSKSGALLIRESGPHYLFWGDSDIRVAQSNDLTSWSDIGNIIISPRTDSFDSRLVESGPPPLLLRSGNYLFLYNSAQKGWPEDRNTAYHVGWVILDRNDPTKVLVRSESPLMGPETAWEKGESPYSCNAPNVIFLEAAYALGSDRFKVFFGGADATVGSAVIEVDESTSSFARESLLFE